MRRILPSLSSALFDSDLVASRMALALAEACWAIMLLWPGDTFGRPTYTLMAKTMPELCWFAVFAVSAAVQVSIVVLRCFDSYPAKVFATWNAALWVYCVGSMLLSVYPPPAAIGGEISLMVSAVWIWARPLIVTRGERLAAS